MKIEALEVVVDTHAHSIFSTDIYTNHRASVKIRQHLSRQRQSDAMEERKGLHIVHALNTTADVPVSVDNCCSSPVF